MKNLFFSISLLLTLPCSLQAAPKTDTKYFGVKLGTSQLRSDFCNTQSKQLVGGVLFGRQLNSSLAVEIGYDYIFHDKQEIKLNDWSSSSISKTYHGIPCVAKLSTSIMESPFDLFARSGGMVSIRKSRNQWRRLVLHIGPNRPLQAAIEAL